MIGSFDEQGNLLQHHSFDPFGKPRDGRLRDNFTDVLTGITIPQNILGSETTNRGFTDHEHLDDAQLIHMNGRVYDYNLGRFLSVDPFIQAPGNSQSMNPYSYIMNNPLAGTDPSGYAADIDQDKLEVKVTSQSRTRSAPTGSRIKRDTSRTITATVTDESGKSSNYVYTAARNGSERAFKITPITLKPDNTDLGSKGQVGVGTSGNSENENVELPTGNVDVGNVQNEEEFTQAELNERTFAYIRIEDVANAVDSALEATTLKQFVDGESGFNIVLQGFMRYIYIDGKGWVDLQHVTSGSNNLLSSSGLGELLGFGIEIVQKINGNPSAFTGEDLRSNSIGAQALWNHQRSGKLGTTVGKEVELILKQMGRPLDRDEARERFFRDE
ncbi:MAG: RHS repeat-associated core domain-containing protein [Enterobacterales bacterium]|nr:RHS repeat-associated core domain-containing protein [Enterobacterales bacterium]